MVNVFPSGADYPQLWPWDVHSELAAAVSGQMALTGHAGREPVRPEFPLAEYLSGVLAALRAVTELRRKHATGMSRDIEIPLHLAIQRMIEWQVPIATGMGRPELRVGNSFPMNFSISNMHRTGDGKFIAVSAANDATAAKLLEMLGGPALRDDPRFSTLQARMAGLDDITAMLDAWAGERTIAQAMQEAAAHDVVLGQIYDTDDIASDPHVIARGNIVKVGAPGREAIPMPCPAPRVAGWTPRQHTLGPDLGADTASVLASLATSLP
ncbi:MAG: CoA transferase [Burkholderiales bacterium]|nr:MAG: CoA transferase [Burkholderiales bacterium]